MENSIQEDKARRREGRALSDRLGDRDAGSDGGAARTFRRRAANRAQHHPLLLVGCYVFDFLAIHPFRDGNGRISRLLTLLALYQAGYEIGRYISLERLIDQTQDTYYDALQAAGHGWHEDEHDIEPWLRYFLGILTAAYKELEVSVGHCLRPRRQARGDRTIHPRLHGRGVHRRRRPPSRPRRQPLIHRQDPARLRDERLIEPIGTGRNARWRKLA